MLASIGALSMVLFGRPSENEVRAFIGAQAERPFSYPDVGATRGEPPPSYTVDHNRVALGSGDAVFERAVAALWRWQMFAIDGVTLCWSSAPIEVGTTVAILAGMAGVWSLNACRIAYIVDERGPITRRGFAYGTLPEHVVRGEERFVIEWDQASGAVTYDLLAMSRPSSPLLAYARPLLRRAQRRFARRSLAAMRAAAAG